MPFGQHDVGEEQVDAGHTLDRLQRLAGIPRFDHLVAVLAQDVGGRLAHAAVVLDDQDDLVARLIERRPALCSGLAASADAAARGR